MDFRFSVFSSFKTTVVFLFITNEEVMTLKPYISSLSTVVKDMSIWSRVGSRLHVIQQLDKVVNENEFTLLSLFIESFSLLRYNTPWS